MRQKLTFLLMQNTDVKGALVGQCLKSLLLEHKNDCLEKTSHIKYDMKRSQT